MLLFLKTLPTWLLFLSAWDIWGAFAYVQTFAFFESVVVLLVLVMLCAILPARAFRDRFVALGATVVLLTTGWFIADKLGRIQLLRPQWLALYVASVAIAYLLIIRFPRFEQTIRAFAERLTVLLFVYVPFAALGLITILVRNV
jgi:hypothetical protein